MNRLIIITIIILTFVVITPGVTATGDECEKIFSEAKGHHDKLEELQLLAKDLDSQFDEKVRADFSLQSEGVINSSHRNDALKISFSRKRLLKTVHSQQEITRQAISAYCLQCTTDLSPHSAQYQLLCKPEL